MSHMPRTRLPAAIWVLGLVSMLMDISSEMVHALLPLFLVDTLGASVLAVGVLEGLAESTALIAKVFSGALSDRLGSRKGLTVGGYALSAVTKPLFALASGSGMVLAARLVDRVGKGVRGAPRDALVADLAPPGARGAAFGLRQSLDTTGAFLGPLVAVVLMLHWRGDFRAIFWVSVVPAALAVALLVIGVREPAREHAPGSPPPVRLAALARLPARYWGVVGVGAVFTLARFSEAFLVLRAQHAGVRAALIPLVMVLMNVTYAATAYPAGRLADRLSRRTLLAWGLLALVGADLILAGAIDWMAMLPGVVLWGVHMGLTQGLFAAMVADAAPADLRGTAFGVFNLASGVSLLLASVIAGALWARWGAPATFLTGAAFATLALAGVMGARTS